MTARVGRYPDDLTPDERYDLIWACDFSLINLLDADEIYDRFVETALGRLRPGGRLFIGWRSNFDGTMGQGNWANWTLDLIEQLKRSAGLRGPRVVVFPPPISGLLALKAARLLHRRVPFYLYRQV